MEVVKPLNQLDDGTKNRHAPFKQSRLHYTKRSYNTNYNPSIFHKTPHVLERVCGRVKSDVRRDIILSLAYKKDK